MAMKQSKTEFSKWRLDLCSSFSLQCIQVSELNNTIVEERDRDWEKKNGRTLYNWSNKFPECYGDKQETVTFLLLVPSALYFPWMTSWEAKCYTVGSLSPMGQIKSLF